MKQDVDDQMQRRVTTLSDGRYLIFYEFDRKETLDAADQMKEKVENGSTPLLENNEETSV